jgi:hypothetical protein
MNKAASARLIPAVASASMLAISACAAAAQTIPSPYTDISSWEDISAYLVSPSAQPPAVQGSNSATIIQNGNNNTATSDVTVPSSVPGGTGSYYGNVTLQTQIGSNNVSNLQAVGNSNTLITSQNGSDNNTSITAYGSGNTFVSTQNGTGLSYTLQRVGTGQSISVSQKN